MVYGVKKSPIRVVINPSILDRIGQYPLYGWALLVHGTAS